MALKSLRKALINVFIVTIAVLCILYQNEVSTAVYNSFVRCITKVIPSLFAMTVISNIIQKCGIIDRIFCRTKLDSLAISSFIFGNIGGYPIGAKLISDMVQGTTLSRRKAEKMLCFSFGCGPAFAIGVSYAVYGNSMCGYASFASIILSNLILLIIYLFKNRSASKCSMPHTNFTTKLVVESVTNSANAMLGITAMIAIFSALVSLLECVLPYLFVSFVPAVFEISNVSELKNIPLPLLTALLAFGGLCVHMQIVSIVNEHFNLKSFYFFRLIQIPLAAVISWIIDYIFKLSDSVSVSSPTIRISQSGSIIPLVCMLAMIMIVFMTKIKQRTA